MYTVIPGTACIVVDRSNKVGYNLDTLCVVTVDTTTGITDTTVVIISNTPTRDTIRDTNVIYTTDTICASIDNGMSNIVTTIVDCAGAMNNSGNVYTALADGCIAITRSGVVGYNLDTLCIVKTDTVTGISDTTVAIISNLPKRDTIRDTNVIITTDTVCVEVELGMNADSIYIVDCAGSMNNSGNVYTVIPGTTCIVVDRSNKVGYNLDTLCVVTVDTTTGITDTTVVIISNTPTRDTIRDTNVIYTTDTICASIDNGMSNIRTTIVDCAGAMNNSGNVYTALTDGCIAITRSGVVGYNLDTLCIVKTDTTTGISDTTVAIISNLPNCKDIIRDTVLPCRGEEEVAYCLPLDMKTLQQYHIYIDGTKQAMAFSSLSGCGEEEVAGGYSFNANQYLDGVGHVLERWGIDSNRTLSPNISFTTLEELVVYMNSVDAQGMWYAEDMIIKAGNPSRLYNTGIGLQIFALDPRVGTFINEYNSYVTYTGSKLMLDRGCHMVVLEDTITGCVDSALICVECVECDSIIEETYVEVPCVNGEGQYCLPIAFVDLTNYNVYIDETRLNTFDMSGCDYDTTAGYDFSTHILSGGYNNGVLHRLDSVRINGVKYGPFSYTSYTELVAYLNSIDPLGAWVVDGDRVAGGRRGGIYGDMRILSTNTGVRHTVGYNINELPKGSEVIIPSGCHWVVVEGKGEWL
ncbi:MAG: hypothetical protein IPK18_05250 [Sphingobacteriales bacterium]|nr:MAG: hypothetical protein IPK18_05250 [Sphingobacteriales bacterium]